ncbi:putative uncharacterized protein [Firmicutes bacterium CAG:321]|nr:putative uncharacterized protein [Firmicutes bacterium CAG:321]
MNNILITLKKELKLIIRDKKSLLMMAITPLFIPIFVILMSYIYEELTVNKDDKTYQIGVNYELSSTERELLSDEVKYTVYSSSKELEEAYNSNKILAYIVKDNNSYNIYANIQSEDGSIVTSLITNYLDNYNNYLGQSYLVNNNIDLSKVYNNLNYNVTEIKGESIFGNQIILMAITFTIMAITLSCIYTSTDTTAGEKERGTLETILTFPIRRKELIFGKYLAISISGIVTLLIGVFLSIVSLYYVKNNFSIYDNVIFNINTITILLTILILLFYTLFISGLCITIASFTKSFKEAQSALTPISLVTCIPMFLEMLNINISGVLSFIPIINHTIVINNILTSSININNILITIISSIIYIIVLLLFINKMYKSEKILFN